MTENFGIRIQSRQADFSAYQSFNLPIINSNNLGNARRREGAIAYDVITKRTWECVEGVGGVLIWRPIASGGGGLGVVKDFSLKMISSQTIPSNADTILVGYTSALPYFDATGQWNPVTGIYTSTETQSIVLNANFTWQPGATNQGERTIKIYKDPAVGPLTLIKSASTQANPSLSSPTTQFASVGTLLDPGDQIYVVAYHNAPQNVNIDPTSTLTGHRTLL